MLNTAVGSEVEIDGKKCILTRSGAVGHAIYGPYKPLDPGYYAVEFCVRPAEECAIGNDEVCAQVDVVVQSGNVVLAQEDIHLSRLQSGAIFVPLSFHNDVRQPVEFRVAVSGQIPLIIDDHCPVIALNDKDADYVALLEQARFPDPNSASVPQVFRDLLPSFRDLHENGAIIKVIDGRLIVTLGVSFYANETDDMILVGELFLRQVYNLIAEGEWCAIDIGMNIGLASLLLAAKPFVKEVHAFEPFASTFERACANLGLNPDIAHKITAYNLGLEDKDEDKTVLIRDDRPSGAFTTTGWRVGTPQVISIRNAATTLRPIIEAAKARGRNVIVKVDCEGSEFPIFATLDTHGLMDDISAFMVEWHRIDWQKTQQDLIAPLLRRGFVVFDLSPRTGNGFFYAVRRHQ